MFSQKVVIVTGASSGIGAGIAVSFAKEGAKLCITGRIVESLEKTASRCFESGGAKPLIMVGDLTKEDHLKDIVDTTVKTYGKIDVLVNNAGMVIPNSLETATLEDFETLFNVNVKAAFFLTKFALPYLLETKGNVVNVSSIAGMKSVTGSLTYNMSKAAFDQFTRCFALEVASKGVRVNSVNPGYVPTNITRALPEEVVTKMEKAYEAIVPLGRNGFAEDVAEAVLYLASDKSSFITGHLVPVDGGRGLVTPRPAFN